MIKNKSSRDSFNFLINELSTRFHDIRDIAEKNEEEIRELFIEGDKLVKSEVITKKEKKEFDSSLRTFDKWTRKILKIVGESR